jgi:hypothetical protein
LLEDLSRELAAEPLDDQSRGDDDAEDEDDDARRDERDAILATILGYEQRYYVVEGQFAEDLEKWFEVKAGPRVEP